MTLDPSKEVKVLRELVDEYLVPEGHEHSEDIIHDPDVVSWIDDYAAGFKQLVEPVWLQTIRDPKSRWYREKPEYKNLFRFHGSSEPLPIQRKQRNVARQYW